MAAPPTRTGLAGGRVDTVRYHLLTPLLLNELQKQQQRIEAQEAQNAALLARLEALETALAAANEPTSH